MDVKFKYREFDRDNFDIPVNRIRSSELGGNDFDTQFFDAFGWYFGNFSYKSEEKTGLIRKFYQS